MWLYTAERHIREVSAFDEAVKACWKCQSARTGDPDGVCRSVDIPKLVKDIGLHVQKLCVIEVDIVRSEVHECCSSFLFDCVFDSFPG